MTEADPLPSSPDVTVEENALRSRATATRSGTCCEAP